MARPRRGAARHSTAPGRPGTIAAMTTLPKCSWVLVALVLSSLLGDPNADSDLVFAPHQHGSSLSFHSPS